MPQAARPLPRATYRLQLSSRFDFAAAAARAPYLARLGISHVYASPFLKARPGSEHGYDIVDHAALNPELGTREDFAAMTEVLRAHGLGLILDFVPNHMGVNGADNPYWLDMLEWGQASAYAGWFDVDWQPEPLHLQGKVLIPVLADQYGAVLAAGGLELRFDAAAGEIAVWAHDAHKLPIHPGHYGRVLGGHHARLEELSDGFSHLDSFRPHAQRRARELKAALAVAVREDQEVAAALARRLADFAGAAGDLESWMRLDGLIADQHWRVAYFRVAADDINYRRFFTINDLAGLRMEHEDVFDHAHRLVFELIETGKLDGLRIDHIDGLLDPKAYCRRLREKAPRPIYLVVEKILGAGEALRDDWQADGTTGYEFANLLTGLLIDPAGEARLDEAYRAFTGRRRGFGAVARECKLAIMEDEMASELGALAREAARVARSNPRTADFTRNVLQRALKEIVAGFEVYRTYVDAEGAGATDLEQLRRAFSSARRAGSGIDHTVFDFLFSLLGCEAVARPGSGFSRQEVVRLAMRFQQYTGPVMAKGGEDTAFYRYNRLIAANEVGGHPGHLGLGIGAFHAANLARHPGAMLATSTHDTKRGEDCRARLAVLAELAGAFAEAAGRWRSLLHRANAPEPDSNDIYLFFQLLIGAWPPGLTSADPDQLRHFEQRLQLVMLKSAREAKVHTNWAAPDEAYEHSLHDFVARALADRDFLADFVAFEERIIALGAANSFVQAVLKFTVPGVPDLYQGAEGFDLSLVDPDNRRPVDWTRLAEWLEASPPLGRDELLDGRAKFSAIANLLALRRKHPMLFAEGDYQPLEMADDRLVAFSRRHGDSAFVVVAARFPSRGAVAGELQLPDHRPLYGDVLTGRQIMPGKAGIDLAIVLADLPAAVLMPAEPMTVRRAW